jgi:aminoacyl tRNA synthase complex-interacting multifunctional protein 1
LQGILAPEEKPDPRGETVPQPFVNSLAELKQSTSQTAPPAVNGDAKDTAQETQKEATSPVAVESVEAASKETPKAEDAPEKKQKSKQDAPTDKKTASFDISQLDIRVGLITKAWEHPEADRLFCENIDIGEEAPRSIASGLRQHYTLDKFEGQRVLVIANLKERKLVGFPSHGMVLCATSADGKVQLVNPPADARVGERITVSGYEGEPATENQVIKKKILEAVFPDLKTDDNGLASYKGQPLMTSAGPCLPTEFPNASIS